MLITAMVRTGNEPTPTSASRAMPPVCGPCAQAQRVLGDAQPFHLATGVIGTVAVLGLALAIFGFRAKRRR